MSRRTALALLLATGSACADGPTSPSSGFTLTCPQAMAVQTTTSQTPVTYAAPTSSGGQAPVTTTCSPASGSSFPVGTTLVKCQATDARGQTATCRVAVLDEAHGIWGQVGTEVSCKSWLSGGRLVVNKKTWFAHMFRTQGGDFGFPYHLSGKQTEYAKKYSRDLWFNNKWPKAKYNLDYIIKHFAPVPDWKTSYSKAAIYYTDYPITKASPEIIETCRGQIRKCLDKFRHPTYHSLSGAT